MLNITPLLSRNCGDVEVLSTRRTRNLRITGFYDTKPVRDRPLFL